MTFKKKKPTAVIMHCSATPDDDEPGRWFDLDISEIDRWHRARGWKGVGYHFFVRRDGTVQPGRPVGTAGAHTKGHNHQIGVCYSGSQRPNEAQLESLRRLANLIRDKHGISPLDWHCHSEYANKLCPGFSRAKLMEYLLGVTDDVA